MNIALILAGGRGSRFNNKEFPKQFVHIQKKPIIIYTLEHFEKHPSIKAIYVVCIQGWEKKLQHYIHRFGITKVAGIIPGGNTGFLSINNGISFISQTTIKENDIVIIHDSVRPFLRQKNITTAIKVAKKRGNAISASPNYEALIQDEAHVLPANKIKTIKAPQAFQFRLLKEIYDDAKREGIKDNATTATLLARFKKPLFFVESESNNIKITTKQDLVFFKTLLKMETKE